jgi:hypothetical protein
MKVASITVTAISGGGVEGCQARDATVAARASATYLTSSDRCLASAMALTSGSTVRVRNICFILP